MLAVRARAGDALTMTFEATLSADGGDSTRVWHDEVPFSRSDRSRPVRIIEIDLSPWAGRLVRFDVNGSVRVTRSPSASGGYVGCSAAVVDRAGATPVQLIGWRNEGHWPFHVGSIGPNSSVDYGDADSPFAYALEGPLWHVLRAREGAALRLQVMPLLPEDVELQLTDSNARSPTRADMTACSYSSERPTGPSRPPDVFIYLIDALRADHVGCYGYERNTTPYIDRFAEQAVVFEQAYSPAALTRPAVTTLLSGLHASSHGVFQWSHKIGEWTVLLPEVLQRAGYRSCCVSGNIHVSEASGLSDRFDHSAYAKLASPQWVNSQAAAFMTNAAADQPVFMYLHTLEPHAPYAPAPESIQLFDRGHAGTCDGSVEALLKARLTYPRLSEVDIEHLIDLYDAEIFDNDRGFGEFLELLRREGRFENALVVLAADHGEGFNEHGVMGHERMLNREVMHVPLIVKFPHGRFSGLREGGRASLVDVFPTVLSAVGLQPDAKHQLPGVDLQAQLSASALDSKRHVYAETLLPGLDLLAVMDSDGYKSVVALSGVEERRTAREAVGLWDIRSDPEETADLRDSLPVRAAYHEQLLARWLLEQTSQRAHITDGLAEPTELTERTKRELRALGYLE
jgi:arylsulfatase A-like enzyme